VNIMGRQIRNTRRVTEKADSTGAYECRGRPGIRGRIKRKSSDNGLPKKRKSRWTCPYNNKRRGKKGSLKGRELSRDTRFPLAALIILVGW